MRNFEKRDIIFYSLLVVITLALGWSLPWLGPKMQIFLGALGLGGLVVVFFAWSVAMTVSLILWARQKILRRSSKMHILFEDVMRFAEKKEKDFGPNFAIMLHNFLNDYSLQEIQGVRIVGEEKDLLLKKEKKAAKKSLEKIRKASKGE